MLPKLPNYVRQEAEDLRGHRRALKEHHSSMNSSMHTRYLSYEEEPTEVGRLKKLREFLCGDQEDSQQVIVVKPTSGLHSRNKQNTQQGSAVPGPRRRGTARLEPTQNGFCQQAIFLSRQRFRLKEMMEPLNARFDPRKVQHRLCDRLRVSKIL